MTNKPYLIIVPVLVAIFIAIFIVDTNRKQNQEGGRSPDSTSGVNDGSFSGQNSDSEARPAKRKQRESRGASPKIRTDSGLIYQILKKGYGASPGPKDTVKVTYRGYLLDGKEFDRSPDNQPVSFPLNRVIPGWTEGLQLMNEGGVYRFTIPPGLAYGNRAAGDKIPPNSTLVFEVELMEVKRAKE